jgi:5,10-methylene-tetrahydrofolate dehydrogenase/methenyl tetrahydrofolate cyclohydrolase
LRLFLLLLDAERVQWYDGEQMAKILNGSELAGFIKERQAKQVRALRQAWHTNPRLVILKSLGASPVIDTYVRMKQQYGDDILIETIIEAVNDSDLPERITFYNQDPATHGIIVQLPLDVPEKTDEIVALIAPEKDVDGLGAAAHYDSATATAVNWLLTGYGVDLSHRAITIVGNGRLVGAPLTRMWQASGYDVTTLDDTHADIASVLRQSQIIIAATGVPRLITADMVPVGAVVVDAGTASEDGMLVGDVDAAVRERDDVTITPVRGGVGPLTIAALFDNVITAARATTDQ